MRHDVSSKDAVKGGAAAVRYRRPWIVRVFWLWQDRGAAYVFRRVLIKLRGTRSYPNWVRDNVRLSQRDVAAIQTRLAALAHRPLISLVVPISGSDAGLARPAIDAVVAQLYGVWELRIAADATCGPDMRAMLEACAHRDTRITVAFDAAADIGETKVAAFAQTRGAWIAFLNGRGVLAPHALYLAVEAINASPDLNLIYTDEDGIDASGVPRDPVMKPDWNPDLLLSHDYLGDLLLLRRSCVTNAGGLRTGYGHAQLYDLVLRVVERIAQQTIRHIPFVLHSSPVLSSSETEALDQEPECGEDARRAVREHLARRGIPATVEPIRGSAGHRVRRAVSLPVPRVSLIIPTRDHADLLRGTITSILERTDYADYEIVIVDNQSEDPQALSYLESLAAEPRVKVLCYAAPFNYSAINNFAARQCTGAILGLVNNDIVVINSDWLTEMVSHALRPEVGAVGAMLYYPNDTIQHAGIVVGFGGSAINCYGGLPRGAAGYQGRAGLVQDYSAVTAACLLTRADVFHEVGGLNETDLAVAFNDVDYCLKLRERGYLNVWTPFAELYHLESASRGDDMAPDKIKRFRAEQRYLAAHWKTILACDPAYNPNLSLFEGLFKLAERSRSKQPWRPGGSGSSVAPGRHAVDPSAKME
jgi:GT2 family glycosyltransferase